MDTVMRYAKQSSEWTEGLPVGNGRLAAMIWGDCEKDIIDLNHEWLWRGNNKNREIIPAAGHLEYVRSLLKERDFFKAALAANLYFAGDGGISPKKNRVDPYQTAGFMEFRLKGSPEFERRELDIEKGVCKISRKISGISVISEFFASCENGLLMGRWYTNDKNGKFSCDISLSRIKDGGAVYKISAQKNRLVFDCEITGGIRHCVISEFQTDGQLFASGDRINIENAGYVKCAVNIATSAFDLEDELKRYPTDPSGFENEKAAHSKKFSGIMGRVSLEIAENPELEKLSVEERLDKIKNGGRDNFLSALYFDFGRYLMVSSSICGDLPANLQGKWNNMIDPPWECDYHCDINLEMNYWMAEQCGMPECSDALLKYLERFYESGREAAKKIYGCRGIFLPIQGDAWGISTPEAFGWAVWIGAAPWLAQNFFNRYIYSGDINYLKNRGYRFLKEVAEFYEDYLICDESGTLQIMPSQSPENTFEEACGYFYLPVGICVSSAMDVQLAYDALGYAAQAAKILNVDADKAELWENMRKKLPDFKIGQDGRLLEWNEEKTEREPELGHRHLSHLYGVYPSALFTGETRVKQYEAAKKSLEFRLSHGGGHTGWSRAWVACLQARFCDAEGFYEHFTALIRDFATVTLLDLHPPRIFQIDGNLGAVAALIESVISYTDGKVHLLRALPKEWEQGSLRGIKVPGGHTVSVWWKNGRAAALKIQIGFEAGLIVKNSGEEKIFSGIPGEIIECELL